MFSALFTENRHLGEKQNLGADLKKMSILFRPLNMILKMSYRLMGKIWSPGEWSELKMCDSQQVAAAGTERLRLDEISQDGRKRMDRKEKMVAKESARGYSILCLEAEQESARKTEKQKTVASRN